MPTKQHTDRSGKARPQPEVQASETGKATDRQLALAPGRLAPHMLTPGSILRLQQVNGNAFVRRMLGKTTPQTAQTHVASSRVQRVLSKDEPIKSTDVKLVTNLYGLVFKLEGHQGDSVVIKFEDRPDAGVTAKEHEARYTTVEELAESVLSGFVKKNVLTNGEIQELNTLTQVQGPDAIKLTTLLNKGLAAASIGLKMDTLNMGKTLGSMEFEKRKNPGKPELFQGMNSALDTRKVERYGQMAYFDVLTRNTDRFKSQADLVQLNNIDFDSEYKQTLPLDNVHNVAILVDKISENLGEMGAIQANARQQYAALTLQTIATAIGVSHKFLQPKITRFLKGMSDAETNAHAVLTRWMSVMSAPDGGGYTPEETKVRRALIQRYNAAADAGMQILPPRPTAIVPPKEVPAGNPMEDRFRG